MATVRFKLDPAGPVKLTRKERTRLASMTEAEIERGARGDRDNPPLSAAELARMRSAREVRLARAATGLSQETFAKRFRIGLGRLRDLEQGRTKADSALLAYLKVIGRARKAVERALIE